MVEYIGTFEQVYLEVACSDRETMDSTTHKEVSINFTLLFALNVNMMRHVVGKELVVMCFRLSQQTC